MTLWLIRLNYWKLNPLYAHIKHQNGKESTVSLPDLAPCGGPTSDDSNMELTSKNDDTSINDADCNLPNSSEKVIPNKPNIAKSQDAIEISPEALRRSTRLRRQPERLDL